MFDSIQKGYYEVYVDGVKVSQHQRQDKAITRMLSEQLKKNIATENTAAMFLILFPINCFILID